MGSCNVFGRGLLVLLVAMLLLQVEVGGLEPTVETVGL